MKCKKQLLSDLTNLNWDRAGVNHMREELAMMEEAEKSKTLSDQDLRVLQEKRKALQEYLLVTVNHISVLEKLLLQLSPEEALIIDRMLINPEKNVIFELMEQLHCESTQLYRIRARALRKLGHLRYGAAWKD